MLLLLMWWLLLLLLLLPPLLHCLLYSGECMLNEFKRVCLYASPQFDAYRYLWINSSTNKHCCRSQSSDGIYRCSAAPSMCSISFMCRIDMPPVLNIWHQLSWCIYIYFTYRVCGCFFFSPYFECCCFLSHLSQKTDIFWLFDHIRCRKKCGKYFFIYTSLDP